VLEEALSVILYAVETKKGEVIKHTTPEIGKD